MQLKKRAVPAISFFPWRPYAQELLPRHRRARRRHLRVSLRPCPRTRFEPLSIWLHQHSLLGAPQEVGYQPAGIIRPHAIAFTAAGLRRAMKASTTTAQVVSSLE